MAARLSIIAYRGSPVDAPEFRHTALFIEFPNNETLLLHITGASGFFATESKSGEEPTRSNKFIKKISVGVIQGQERANIESTIKATPIKNLDRSWNCQNWIGDALKRLSDQRWITPEARSAAIDAMAEVIIDAPDES